MAKDRSNTNPQAGGRAVTSEHISGSWPQAPAASSPTPGADVAEESGEAAVWHVLAGVPDPEIPILSIVDLGIVRHVRWQGDAWRVGITPTYSGCPATEVIRQSVKNALLRAGYAHAMVEDVLSPAWTSDWITEEGRRKLGAYGIAPPAESVSSVRSLLRPVVIACPRCGSRNTERLSEFGSTPCKAHYRCRACLEPFDYFKCI